MINFISYILFFFGNFLLILFLDNNVAQKFLSTYSLSGLILGPLIFLYFSREQKNIKYSQILVLLINCSLFYFNNNFIYLVIVYSLNLFYSDFISSQSNSIKRLNFIYKTFIFLSVIPFIFNFLKLEQLIEIRIFLASLLVFMYLFVNFSYNKIDVKFPIIYLISTNLVYFGSLFFITILIKSFILKIIYIAFQVCFSLILKLYDLKLRNILDRNKFEKYFKNIYIVLICFPLIFLIYNVSEIILFIYYLNMFFFYMIKKKLL